MNCIHFSGLYSLPYGFRRRLLMPLVRPFHGGILFVAIPFLGFAHKLFAIAFDLLQFVIDKLAVFLFEFPLKLQPFPLSCSAFIMASSYVYAFLSPCPYQSVLAHPNLPPYKPL